MRIEHLRLRNFRCFEDRTFLFADGFNLLIGANATGKTAILDALAIATGAALTSIPDVSSRLIRRMDVRRSCPAGTEVGSFEEHYPACVAAEGMIGDRSLSWQREFRTPKSHTTHRDARNTRDAMRALIDEVRDGGDALLPMIGYYGTGRLWLEQRKTDREGGIEPAAQATRYTGYRNCLTSRSSTRPLLKRIKRLTLIQAQRGVRLHTLTAILDSVAACVDAAETAHFDFDEDDILLTFADGGRFPFRMLSDGQRGMAALAADIAMRCTLLNPHMNGEACRETPGVVLIDELDLHLHPRWQRRVVSDLRDTFPKMQFIASSHSPFIVQSMAERGGVINLDSEGDGESSPVAQQSIEDVAEYLMQVEHPQRSRRFIEMSRAAEEYFEALEGASDQDPERIRQLRQDLDRLQSLYADNPAYAAFLRMRFPSSTASGD